MASKLFLGVDVGGHLEDTIFDVVSLGEWKQLKWHITFQYCGKEVDDAEFARIRAIWEDVLSKLNPENGDLDVVITKEFARFGPQEDLIVVICRVSQALEDAVGEARALTGLSSDHPFTAHITLGEGHDIPNPKNIQQEDFGKFTIDKVTFWGDNYDVRGSFEVQG